MEHFARSLPQKSPNVKITDVGLLKNSWSLCAFVLLLTACSSTSNIDNEQSLDTAKILQQVNDAINDSIDPNNKDFPPLTSVTLDLQISIATQISADAKNPIALIPSIGANANHEKLHRITLTFVPQPRKPASDTQTTEANAKSQLTKVLRTVYDSVAHSNNPYKFQHGSITLQCTLKQEVSAGLNFLGLVPIEFGGDYTNEKIQSLTLNFGKDPDKGSGSSDSSESFAINFPK